MKNFLKYLLLIIPFVAFNDIVKTNKKAITLPIEQLDTIKTFPPVGQTKPLLFETAFITGTTGKLNKETLSLSGINIGKIKLSGGRLVACDPMHIDEYGIPFTQPFAKGEYPVQLAIAKLDLEERVAFARILISVVPVVKWKFALLEGQTQMPWDLKKGMAIL